MHFNDLMQGVHQMTAKVVSSFKESGTLCSSPFLEFSLFSSLCLFFSSLIQCFPSSHPLSSSVFSSCPSPSTPMYMRAALLQSVRPPCVSAFSPCDAEATAADIRHWGLQEVCIPSYHLYSHYSLQLGNLKLHPLASTTSLYRKKLIKLNDEYNLSISHQCDYIYFKLHMVCLSL